MAVNFQQERQNLIDIFEDNLNSQSPTRPSISEVATQISNWYDSLVRSGQDALYGNSVIQANRPGLQTSLETGFQSAFEIRSESSYQIASNAFQIGIIAYWTGAQLEFAVPPPPSIQVTNNVVTTPGTFQLSIPQENDSQDEFINTLFSSIRTHFQTVSGVTTGLTPQPTGPPVPVPYTWTGYF